VLLLLVVDFEADLAARHHHYRSKHASMANDGSKKKM
jgi:hypothetical protein